MSFLKFLRAKVKRRQERLFLLFVDSRTPYNQSTLDKCFRSM